MRIGNYAKKCICLKITTDLQQKVLDLQKEVVQTRIYWIQKDGKCCYCIFLGALTLPHTHRQKLIDLYLDYKSTKYVNECRLQLGVIQFP